MEKLVGYFLSRDIGALEKLAKLYKDEIEKEMKEALSRRQFVPDFLFIQPLSVAYFLRQERYFFRLHFTSSLDAKSLPIGYIFPFEHIAISHQRSFLECFDEVLRKRGYRVLEFVNEEQLPPIDFLIDQCFRDDSDKVREFKLEDIVRS